MRAAIDTTTHTIQLPPTVWEAFRQQLPQNFGRLLPLYTELADFDRFGTDVAQYMLFVFQLTRVCFWLFILNLSNILKNLEGGHADDFLAKHSLNNADCLGISYGVVELLTSALFVAFLFYARTKMFERAQVIAASERNSAQFGAIPAQFSEGFSIPSTGDRRVRARQPAAHRLARWHRQTVERARWVNLL